MTNLKNIRIAQNMTQSKLAEISGVNIRMIQHYEQGRKDINKAEALTVYKLSQALECKIEDLLEFNYLIVDDLSKSIDPNRVANLRKVFEEIKKEVEE